MYKKACCCLHLYIKICSASEEERAYSVLFNALSNEKSQGFLNVVRLIVKTKHLSNDDILLLSVRASDELIVAILLKVCDRMQSEFLKVFVEEEKVRKENKERVYKVMFCKQSSGAYTPRVVIPDSMLRDLNIRPGDYVQYTRVEDGILIRKKV